MKYISLILIVCLSNFCAIAQNSPVDYVNPLMGTDSKPDLSNGNTYPAIRFALGDEYVDTTNRQNGRWVAIPICGR